MVTLLHTADTHLGYRQYHRPEREADFRAAFAQVIDAAIDEDVDAVVHAGDLFNSSRPGIEVLSDALSGLQRLRSAGISFLGIVGNHDGTRNQQWIDVFESLGLATRLDDEGITVGGGTDVGSHSGSRPEPDSSDRGDDGPEEGGQVALYGLDYVEPGRRDRLEYAFDTEAASRADAALLVAHGLFEPCPNGDWDAAAICRQSTVAFDAILAGDDHTPREDTVGDGTLITYPGSTERTAADQRDPRRFDLVRVSTDGEIEIDSRELDTREFVYVDVEMDDGDGADRVLAELDAVYGRRDDGFEEGIVIVTLVGAGERVSAGPIEEFGLDRGALVVRVNDRREFDEEIQAYGDVAFADPEAAVQRRRRTLGLSELGGELEELARSTEEVPDSNVTDVVEERVRGWLEERSLEAFERTEPTDATEPSELSEATEAGRTAEATDEAESDPATQLEGGDARETSASATRSATGGSRADDGESPAPDRTIDPAAAAVDAATGSKAATEQVEATAEIDTESDSGPTETDSDDDGRAPRTRDSAGVGGTDAGDHDAEPEAGEIALNDHEDEDHDQDHDAEPPEDERSDDPGEHGWPIDEGAERGADPEPESIDEGTEEPERTDRTTQSTLWDV